MEERQEYHTDDGREETREEARPQRSPTYSEKSGEATEPQYKQLWVSPDTHHRVKLNAARAGMAIKDYVRWAVSVAEKAWETE